jgi:outer membrane protein OmpA-like peptidoglycan-associated protein
MSRMEMLSKLKPGDVLGQVDLASYIGAMAKGVAEAQKALDDNTIGLLGQFAQPIDNLAGKSLLALGLSPAFYHFRSATISASVSMSIRVRQEIDVSVHVEAGQSKSSTTKVRSGSRETTSATETIHLSESKTINASNSGNTVEKIDSYAASNSTSSQHFTVAERAEVSNKSQFAASGFARYNSTAALFVVQPAGKRWAVLCIADPSSGETFQINGASGAPYYSAPAQTSAKLLAEGVASHAQGMFVVLLSPDPAADDLKIVKFTTGSHVVKTIGTVDYAARLRALAHIIVKAQIPGVKLVGQTDGVGPKAYNQKLSLLRAQAVKDVLVANGVTAGTISMAGVGETFAVNDLDEPDARNVTISFTQPQTAYFVFLCEIGGMLNPNIAGAAGTGNHWVASEVYDGSGTVNGATVNDTTQLLSQINGGTQATASAVGELVYLTNRETGSNKIAKVSVYAATGSSLETSSASNLTFDQATSEDKAAVDTSETETNRAVAVAGSLDVRFSRMFDVSMAGNMSIAAELVSIPPPAEFLEFIKETLGD